MTVGSGQKWNDLKARAVTGLLLALVAGFVVWIGGVWFLALVVVATFAMIWELSRITGATRGPLPVMFGAAGALAITVFSLFPEADVKWAVFAITVVFGVASTRLTVSGILYITAIMLTGIILLSLRYAEGSLWIAWLVLVVVASDIAGYLAGRALGGPKFWPRISPKKTWSGTIAGWIAAACVGAVMASVLHVGNELILISALLAFAGQMGDIAESALKRQAGIKDSSNLLPGHGGVLDRLDALIGAAIGMLIIMAVYGSFG